jgi:hypothetical protein
MRHTLFSSLLRVPFARLLVWRLRAVLSAAGISVSVGSMVFLLSGSESVFQSLLGGLTRAGARTLYVVPGTQTILTGLPRRPFTQREADALERRIPDVEIAAPLITLSSVAQLCGATRIVRLIGVLPLNEYVDSLQDPAGGRRAQAQGTDDAR